MPLAKAENPTAPDFTSISPVGFLSLDKSEQKYLASYIKQCQIDKKDLSSAKRSYKICVEKNEIAPAWWQSPWGVIGIAVVSGSVGALISN